MTDSEYKDALIQAHSFHDKQRLYRRLAHFVRWHDQLTATDIADAKQVLSEFDYLKDKP
jgi:hypothetical protein